MGKAKPMTPFLEVSTEGWLAIIAAVGGLVTIIGGVVVQVIIAWRQSDKIVAEVKAVSAQVTEVQAVSAQVTSDVQAVSAQVAVVAETADLKAAQEAEALRIAAAVKVAVAEAVTLPSEEPK